MEIFQYGFHITEFLFLGTFSINFQATIFLKPFRKIGHIDNLILILTDSWRFVDVPELQFIQTGIAFLMSTS